MLSFNSIVWIRSPRPSPCSSRPPPFNSIVWIPGAREHSCAHARGRTFNSIVWILLLTGKSVQYASKGLSIPLYGFLHGYSILCRADTMCAFNSIVWIRTATPGGLGDRRVPFNSIVWIPPWGPGGTPNRIVYAFNSIVWIQRGLELGLLNVALDHFQFHCMDSAS